MIQSTPSQAGVPRIDADSRLEERQRHLEQRAREALIDAYWDVEACQPGCGHFALHRNLRLPQRLRPIVVQLTTRLDDRSAFLDFVAQVRERHGNRSTALLVECESTTIGGNDHLYFESLALATAIGSIVSFFARPEGVAVFRLTMSHSGNRFHQVHDPRSEMSDPTTTEARVESEPRVAERDEERSPEEASTTRMGTLTAWKSEADEPHKEYGWIEDCEGNKYNAYWRAFTSEADLDMVRELADEYREVGSSWAEVEMPVRFEVGPPQRRGQHPRALRITLVTRP